MRTTAGLLDGAVGEAQKSWAQDDFKEFRREIGSILGETYDLILEDIWDEFPELFPDEGQSSSVAIPDKSVAEFLKQAEEELEKLFEVFESKRSELEQLKDMVNALRTSRGLL